MDLRESPEQQEVRERYVAWLTDFLPADYQERYDVYRWDLGLRRAHQEAAFEAGWLQPTWPREHGGQSLGPVEAMTVRLESALRAAPKLPNIQGVNVVAPGLREFGTPEQVERLLVPVLRGSEWWALGMSEPGAGSDFAALRTRAERRGDHYVVNGQKIWTTQAHESRWATLYVRTDVEAPRHLLPAARPHVARHHGPADPGTGSRSGAACGRCRRTATTWPRTCGSSWGGGSPTPTRCGSPATAR